MRKQTATAIKTCNISLGSYAKSDQVLLPWESDGCHFETELPRTLFHTEAQSKGFYLLNTEQPKEALILQEITRKSRFLQYTTY